MASRHRHTRTACARRLGRSGSLLAVAAAATSVLAACGGVSTGSSGASGGGGAASGATGKAPAGTVANSTLNLQFNAPVSLNPALGGHIRVRRGVRRPRLRLPDLPARERRLRARPGHAVGIRRRVQERGFQPDAAQGRALQRRVADDGRQRDQLAGVLQEGRRPAGRLPGRPDVSHRDRRGHGPVEVFRSRAEPAVPAVPVPGPRPGHRPGRHRQPEHSDHHVGRRRGLRAERFAERGQQPVRLHPEQALLEPGGGALQPGRGEGDRRPADRAIRRPVWAGRRAPVASRHLAEGLQVRQPQHVQRALLDRLADPHGPQRPLVAAEQAARPSGDQRCC